jgi:formate-dependent nitrite reductase cytochrome c552 subunit
MSSPSKFFASSPIRNLEEKYYSRPLEVILEEQNALRLSNSLIFKNQLLEKENERLIIEHGVQQEQAVEAVRIRQERDRLE